MFISVVHSVDLRQPDILVTLTITFSLTLVLTSHHAFVIETYSLITSNSNQ